MVVSIHAPHWEKARFLFSPDALARLCNDYYHSICGYNTNWPSISTGRIATLLENHPSMARAHAISLMQTSRLIRAWVAESGIEGVQFRLTNPEIEDEVESYTCDDAYILSLEMRKSKPWDDDPLDWIIADPKRRQVITLSSNSSDLGPLLNNLEADDDDLLQVKNARPKGYMVSVHNLKLAPYTSRGRKTSETVVLPQKGGKDRLWELSFLYRTLGHADEISTSLKLGNRRDITFDHLQVLSHPTKHGSTALAQYYLVPIHVIRYGHERGQEISWRMIATYEGAQQNKVAIPRKLGRLLEREFERDGVAYLVALVKQFYGGLAKRVIDYKLVGVDEYHQAMKMAEKNYDGNGSATYLAYRDISANRSDVLYPTIRGFSVGDVVKSKTLTQWGLGEISTLRYSGQGDTEIPVARVAFEYGGQREVILDYIDRVV